VANDTFDLAAAERMLVNALATTQGADKISLFTPMAHVFRDSLSEVKRLRVTNAAMLSEAVRELSAAVIADLSETLVRFGEVTAAVTTYREENFETRRDPDGKYRWKVKPQSDLHAAIEKLSAAVHKAQKA
jgi:hypothetical protein